MRWILKASGYPLKSKRAFCQYWSPDAIPTARTDKKVQDIWIAD
jgi:hypothetical protein